MKKKMGMLKLVDRSRLGRGEVNSYKFESYYPYYLFFAIYCKHSLLDIFISLIL